MTEAHLSKWIDLERGPWEQAGAVSAWCGPNSMAFEELCQRAYRLVTAGEEPSCAVCAAEWRKRVGAGWVSP